MILSPQIVSVYESILQEELLVAMGCTEPIAIAYAASIVRECLGVDPDSVRVELSGNIIKNVKSVIVPGTGGLRGIEAAIAAGVAANAPERELQVLSGLSELDRVQMQHILDTCDFQVKEMETECVFEILLEGMSGQRSALVRIVGNHTNVVQVVSCGKDVTSAYCASSVTQERSAADRSALNVQDIVAFAEQADLTRLAPLLSRQIQMNMAIAEEGLRGQYGASIGKVLYGNGGGTVKDRARAHAAAGSDARMSGCEMPVGIVSGSGNQGITASVPVVIYARDQGASEEETLRAVLLSNLITIHQKTGIGCLSAYCGAISAGCGAAAGICFLKGGRFYEIAHTLVNAVAILSGTICDGAKPSCAAKIAMAVEAGILGYEMMCSGHQFYGGDGIITKGVENTIRNIGRLARDGMSETDKEIIRIMLQTNEH